MSHPPRAATPDEPAYGAAGAIGRPPAGPHDASAPPFWSLPLAALLAQIDSDGTGLTADEAERRLRRLGPNDLAGQSRWTGLWRSFRRIINPLLIILLVASAISVAIGEVIQAGVITLMVVFSAAIDLFQAHRSQRSADRLRRRVEVRATVRRDGIWVDISLRQVVPGDRIRLSAGDIVPADARLVETTGLYLDEAAFTGESLPVEKHPAESAVATAAGTTNAVFMGTVVTSGSGEAIVARTGVETTYAAIAARLETAVPYTAFDRGLRDFSTLIARTVSVLVLFVLIINLIARRDPLESLLFAVALAVGLTPEFLPMILTVTQAEGALRMARSKVIVRQLAAIQNFGSIDVLCSDKTGTLTEGRMRATDAVDAAGAASARVRRLAYLNAACQEGLRSPFDEALLAQASSSPPHYRRLGELPFDFVRRRVSVAVELEGEALLITLGAPESVLAVATTAMAGARPVPLDAAQRAVIAAQVERFGAQGLRLLAAGTRPLAAGQALSAADEAGLVFEGLVTFSDPPKEGVAAAVAALRRDGIRLVVISGDAAAVTREVCLAIGFADQPVVTGEALEALDDLALRETVQQRDIYARVAPEQKLRLIRALQRAGHVVGYLGDGINDAPALRAADVGISVAGAVDVAREAARVVLLEKSLSALHQGVIEGRKSFGNVMKYIMMGTSSNFGNMLSMAGAVLFLPFLPMLPPQILLNNWLYDLTQMSIPVDHVDDALVRKPRTWDMRFIRRFMLLFGPISSLYDFLTFFALRTVFHAGPALFHTGWFVESLATQTLVIFVIRTTGNPLRSRPSPLLVAAAGGGALVGMLLPFTPLAGPLGFVAPPFGFMVFVAACVVTYLLLVEVVKRRFYRLHALAE